MDYEKLARDIYDLMGPADNITQVYHCMTRLRLHVQEEHFTKEQLSAIPGVLGINKSGDEWQIVVGPGKAGKVTAAFKTLMVQPAMPAASPSSSVASLAKQAAVGDGQALHEAIRKKKCHAGQIGFKENCPDFYADYPGIYCLRLDYGHPQHNDKGRSGLIIPAARPNAGCRRQCRVLRLKHLRRH